jgi:CRP-like cAMP-binding protein
LIARRGDHIAGAIGYALDRFEGNVRVFELLCIEEPSIWFLLSELEKKCREQGDLSCIEIDVNAHSPRMQRTLLELGYLPVAYVPAMAFHQVERLDVVKMQRLLCPFVEEELELAPPADEVARLVLRGFERREVEPRIRQLVGRIGLFEGLTDEQVMRLAGACGRAEFSAGQRVFDRADPSSEMYFILDGEVSIAMEEDEVPVGRVGAGECLGEISLLGGTPHAASAQALETVKAGVLTRRNLQVLVRQRPDIAVVLYRNLASGLGSKLRRVGRTKAELEAARAVARD